MDNNLNSESNDILIEQYNNYKNVLNEMEELEKNDFENDTSTLYTLKNVVRPKTKVALQFYFNLKLESNLFYFSDNGTNFANIIINDETKHLINDYLEGSQVCINYENNLIYLKLGTTDELFNINFLCKQFIDALSYINNLLK